MSRVSRRRPGEWGSGALALLALLASSCEVEREPAPVRDLLLVTLDTTRADVLSGDAANRALAPRIAALGENGVRFSRTYTVAPLTLPAHASLLTGLVPPRHGVRDNGHGALPESAHTLAEVLRERGFETAAFVSALVLDRGFGLAQGFEHWDQPPLVARELGVEHLERPARSTVDAAIAWLRERETAQPFFLWVHLYDAHFPYAPAPEHLAHARQDPYRGEIVALDEAVGRLVDALAENGFAPETLIALTANHGESLGEHGEPMHGALCYEPAVRVPLLFHFPSEPPLPGPTRLASLVDLFPTVLGRLGAPIPPELDGVDLFAGDAPLERGVYFESLSGHLNFGWSPLVGWVDGRGKYLHSSEPEFYSILRDPLERSDLAGSRVRECERAREHLAEVLARPALAGEPRETSAALDAALSALGYARGGSSTPELPPPLAPSNLPSPRSRAHELQLLQRAHELFEAQRYDECRPLAAEIVHENPRHLLATDYLALCLMHAHEFERAEELLRQRLSLAEAADARLNLGLCRLELGDPEAALREIEAADRLAPGHPEIRAALARVRPRLGR